MTSRKLLVVNLYYPPDLASTGHYAADICAAIARQGVMVRVVAGEPSYTRSAPSSLAYELRDGVHVHRVRLGGVKGRERMVTRLLAYFRFLWGAWRLSTRIASRERPDFLLTFHNPPIVGLIAAFIARRHRIRYVYVFYDIQPDAVMASKWIRLPPPIVWLWRRTNRWIESGAHTIVVIGQGMKRTMIESHGAPAEKVTVIPLWGRPELTPVAGSQELRRELGVGEGEILLLYAGNMGTMHPLERILDAAEALRDAPLRFLFMGDGAKRHSLQSRVTAQGLDRVSFLPFQEEGRFIQIMAASDACFVTLEAGLERLAVPSRAFTILSAGRALITLMAPEADIAQLVTESRCGWNATGAEELTRILEDIVRSPQELPERGRRGRELYDQRFKREHVVDQYVRVVLG